MAHLYSNIYIFVYMFAKEEIVCYYILKNLGKSREIVL